MLSIFGVTLVLYFVNYCRNTLLFERTEVFQLMGSEVKIEFVLLIEYKGIASCY